MYKNMGKRNTRRRTNKRKKIMKGGTLEDKLNIVINYLVMTDTAIDWLGSNVEFKNKTTDFELWERMIWGGRSTAAQARLSWRVNLLNLTK